MPEFPGQSERPYGDNVPRRPRVEIAGGFFHVTARGNALAPLFLDRFDHSAFLGVLERTVELFSWPCLAFCLMPNHYHLLIQTLHANRGAGMRHLNGSYAQRFNARYDGSGHVFQGPYRAVEVRRGSHLLEVCRYIVLNPVRAALCHEVSDWRWSSYRATAGLDPAPPFMAISDVLAQFGASRDRSVRAYRGFIQDGVAASAMSPDRVPGWASGAGATPGSVRARRIATG